LVLVALIVARPGHEALLWGASLVFLGVVLRFYAKGCLRQDEVVAMSGPYRFVRHPFYTGNLLVDQGIAVMSGWWPLMLLLPVWWLLVYRPVMQQEEQHLAELHPDVYPAYQRRTSRLIPLRRPLPATGAGFAWRNPNIVADAAVPRAVRTLAYPLLFAIWPDIKSTVMGSAVDWTGLRLAALSALVAVYAICSLLARHLRARRGAPA
jgi:protein-S-isoprenylcysteine O-methyltransferase Ste14